MVLVALSRRPVEWHAHDKETHAEHWLSLGNFDFALVGAIWGASLT
jgi:hypothetical protein